MPLILNDKHIHTINGPTKMYILEPINPNVNKNYLIFFGDTHDMKNFIPCSDDPNCIELQTDFIKILNKFAYTTRTDFYIEKFFDISKKQISNERTLKGYENTASTTQDVYYSLRNDPEIRKKDSESILKNYESIIDKNPFRIRSNRSNMTELESLNYSCFNAKFKDKLCKFKNIKWHYADARLSTKYFGIKYSIEKITHIINLKDFFSYFANDAKEINSNDLTELSDNITESRFADNIIDVLNDMYIMLTDTDNYVRKLLSIPIIQKQIAKMNEDATNVFTKESFIELLECYKSMFNTTDFSHLINMIQLLIQYFSYSDDNVKERTDVLKKLNSIHIESSLVENYYYIFMALGNLSMDMYFILRINKNDNNHSKKKLVLSYFGSLHSDCISNYFINIVKTHKFIAKYDAPSNMRRIYIPDTIDFNNILFDNVKVSIKSKKTKSLQTNNVKSKKTRKIKSI